MKPRRPNTTKSRPSTRPRKPSMRKPRPLAQRKQLRRVPSLKCLPSSNTSAAVKRQSKQTAVVT